MYEEPFEVHCYFQNLRRIYKPLWYIFHYGCEYTEDLVTIIVWAAMLIINSLYASFSDKYTYLFHVLCNRLDSLLVLLGHVTFGRKIWNESVCGPADIDIEA